MRTYTRKMKTRRAKRQEKKQKGRKIKEKERDRKQNEHALRAQAVSRRDRVAVCWYDNSYDMSS